MSSKTSNYFKARDVLLYLSAPILVIGGLNWLATGIQNLRKGEAATKSDDLLNRVPGLTPTIINIIYILVGIAAIGMLAFAFMYTFGAPSFLDESFFPSTLTVAERPVESADAAVKISTTPFAKIAYWAARPAVSPGSIHPDANTAYGKYENAGVAIADANGNAVLRFRRPGAYIVRGRKLEPHVHYRIAPSITLVENGYEAQVWGPVESSYNFQNFSQ